MDIVDEINAIHRTVGRVETPAGEARTVLLRRTYDTSVDDLWDAVTNPERLPRWFAPVSGDLTLGGRYQVQGNAGGEIIRCEPPRLFRLTWIFGEPVEGGFSEVEVRLSPAEGADAERATLELEHVAVIDPERWAEYGPGAAGVGWDLSLLGLGLYLGGSPVTDPEVWGESREAREFMTLSSNAWGAAAVADGDHPDAVAAMVANTSQFYAPDPQAGPNAP
ncbi:SRPBCC family protein [Plantactinospora endophytica]|uniref:Activator of HSP90 ATPase n=1 Tax=Plantactinospora endophytica TaxID=673535 RepID=A0ABQ4E5F1_9ACTN|nr:SRPBCC family protein [Plantactinospora endophytica]GIG89940.1 activator of HSP90 ATPase [Plantactinospora endophytica]